MKLFEGFDNQICGKLFNKNAMEIGCLKQNNLLFEGNKQFKNKFYFENLTDDCFFDISGVKDDFVRFYKRIVKTGVGSVILGGIDMLENSKQYNKTARISLDENIVSSYKEIALFSHSTNCKIYLKVNAGIGRFLNNKQCQIKQGSSFCLDPQNKQKIVIRTSDNKCNELVNEFKRIVMLASISNLDGVVIDASFSNLIGELSSQEFNKRIFGYYSNTNDFLSKALKGIDKKDKLIILKISLLTLFSANKNSIELCKENNSFSEEKLIEDLKNYIRMGVDGFEFVFGRWENEFLTNFNCHQDELLFEDFIRKFKICLNENQLKRNNGEDILIFYHDNYSNFSRLEILAKENIVNFFDVTRNIYSDLNFLNQTKNANLVRNCLKCSFCNKISIENKKIECVINPMLTDFEPKIIYNKTSRVAVVGSGISGLICSLTLIKRGFLVSLFEQENELNPIGKLTTIFGFDKSLLQFYKTIDDEINSYTNNKKLEIFLNQKFTSEKENVNKFKTIIVATGFKSKFLAISGAVQAHVLNIYDALKKEKLLKIKKHIVIYAKSILSLKLALYLSSQNKIVSLVIKDIKLLELNKNADLFYYFYNLYRFNVKIYFMSRITQINEDNIDVIINKTLKPNNIKTMIDVFSNSKLSSENQIINLDCDLLIYEPETTPNNSLYTQIISNRYRGEVYLIGDALKCADLNENIKSGYFVGKNL